MGQEIQNDAIRSGENSFGTWAEQLVFKALFVHGERSMCQLTADTNLGSRTVSRALQALQDQWLIDSRFLPGKFPRKRVYYKTVMEGTMTTEEIRKELNQLIALKTKASHVGSGEEADKQIEEILIKFAAMIIGDIHSIAESMQTIAKNTGRK